jgi:hypothetical protein
MKFLDWRCKVKQSLFASCFLLSSLVYSFAAPENITAIKVSAFCYDTNGVIIPDPYIWNTNCGLFDMKADGSLVVSARDIFDFFWTLDSNTNLVLRP